MDSKVFRMAILTIISAFILVLVIVYATNADKINKMFGWGSKKAVQSEEAATETSQEIIYGEQIGDNLGAFMYDENFFDETEKVPAVVVIKKSTGAGSETEGDSGLASSAEQEDKAGTGMAVVGELQNPNPDPPVDSAGYLTSVPQAPPGGFGEFIPSGSVVGSP